MSGQGREEKGLFPKGMILACVILFLLGIGCVGMKLAAGPSEEKNPMGQIADYRKKEEKKKEAEKKKLEEQKKQKKSTDEKKNADPDQDMTEELAQKYYYQKLSAEEQKYYKEILKGLEDMETVIHVSTADDTKLQKVFEYIMYDMPTLFWCDRSWSGSKYLSENRTEISPGYTCTKAERDVRQNQVDEAVGQCLSGIDKDADDYTKIKAVFEYLVNTVDYDKNAADNQNVYSALVGKRSVCAGYARSTQLLLEKLGIQCLYVEGTAGENNEAHAWNIVKCNGKYYQIDTTWGDPIYDQTENPETNAGNNINYDYLCTSDEKMYRNHTIKAVTDYPVCDSDDLNYFKLNNMYYESYDAATLMEKMKESYQKKEDSFTCEFSNPDVYAQAREDIINNLLPQASQGLAQYYGFSRVRYSYSEYTEHYRITVDWQYFEYTGN